MIGPWAVITLGASVACSADAHTHKLRANIALIMPDVLDHVAVFLKIKNGFGKILCRVAFVTKVQR